MEDERWFHLSDAQWAQIEGAFPQRRGTSGFERKISNRLAFEGVLHRARVGCPWRDLPGEYGADYTIYMRWQRWVKGGVPQHAMIAWYLEAAKQGKLDLSLALVDFTIVRSTSMRQVRAKNGGDQDLGRRRGGLSTKIHTVAVSEFQVLGLVLTGGQAGDAPAGVEMLAKVHTNEQIRAVGGDRAYGSGTILALIALAGKEAVIPPRSHRHDPPTYDKAKYKGRNKVERLCNRLKGYRAVAARYDKLAAMF